MPHSLCVHRDGRFARISFLWVVALQLCAMLSVLLSVFLLSVEKCLSPMGCFVSELLENLSGAEVYTIIHLVFLSISYFVL